MLKSWSKISITIIVLCLSHKALSRDTEFQRSPIDLTIVGSVKYRDSLGRLPIALTDLFKNDFSINYICSGRAEFEDVPSPIQSILKNPDKTPGNVALLFDILWDIKRTPADFVPRKSFIKIAYSMLESSAIPAQWVTLLNSKFDLVIVPDDYYQGVYNKCGVTIPIFVLPHGIDLEDFLGQPVRQAAKKPFVFGCTGTFCDRKNHELLIEAFYQEFGNNERVKLRIHGRNLWFNEFNLRSLQKKLSPGKRIRYTKLKNGRTMLTPNIELTLAPLSKHEYLDFFNSLDCYVLLSKGEGFSLTPREALALGKPCIISDNTAHHTIAQTGFVYAVPSNNKEAAYYANFKGSQGYNFNCSLKDARKALREVYNNYELYLEKALEGRKWVESYLWENVKARFSNFIKPKKVLLGAENKVTDDYLMTSSEKLYERYSALIS